MKRQCKRYRDSAKISVFSHLSQSVLAVILSGLVSTVIVYYYQFSAIERNVDIFSINDPEALKTTLAVSLMALFANLPLSFCATRFYLLISRTPFHQPVRMKEFFAPFSKPSYILKGSVLVLLNTVITMLGAFVLVFPVYFAYCMAVFCMADNSEISPFKALALSRRMMRGHKWLAFRTMLPLFAVYILFTGVLSSFMFFSFLITSTVEAMIFVCTAHIYNDLRNLS